MCISCIYIIQMHAMYVYIFINIYIYTYIYIYIYISNYI